MRKLSTLLLTLAVAFSLAMPVFATQESAGQEGAAKAEKKEAKAAKKHQKKEAKKEKKEMKEHAPEK